MTFWKKNHSWILKTATACFAVFIIVYFRSHYYQNCTIPQWTPDSWSYTSYDYRLCLRPPGYPALLDLFDSLYSVNGLVHSMNCQIVLSFLSVFFVFLTLYQITKRYYLSLILTVFYGLLPSVICWDTFLLTESMTLTLTVLFICTAVRWLTSFSFIDGILFASACLLAPIYKTSLFVYPIAALLVSILVLIFDKRGRITAVIVMICLIPSFLFIRDTCRMTKEYTGVYAVSSLEPRHKLALLLRSNLYKNHPDKELVEKIETIYEGNNYSVNYDTTDPVMELFAKNLKDQNTKLSAFNEACLQGHAKEYIEDILDTMRKTMKITFDDSYMTPVEDDPSATVVQKMLSHLNILKIGYAYLLTMGCLMYFLFSLINKDGKHWIWLGLGGGMITILVSVYAGTYMEWIRVLVYLIPFMVISLGAILSEILNHYDLLRALS